MNKTPRILFYGYGNPGRQDDGLGNEFVNEAEKMLREKNLAGIDFDSNYQLNIEDADNIAAYDYVIFVDASEEDIEDFYLSEVKPSNSKVEFTMHAVSAAFVLDLCQKIYSKYPKTYLLHIKGYEWEFAEGLSDKAKSNLKKAIEFVMKHIKNPLDFKDLTK